MMSSWDTKKSRGPSGRVFRVGKMSAAQKGSRRRKKGGRK